MHDTYIPHPKFPNVVMLGQVRVRITYAHVIIDNNTSISVDFMTDCNGAKFRVTEWNYEESHTVWMGDTLEEAIEKASIHGNEMIKSREEFIGS